MRNVSILLLMTAACAAPGKPFDERRLDVLPEGLLARSYRFSRDGRVVGYVRLESQERHRVVVRLVEGPALALIC